MPVSRKHILEQGPVLGMLGKTALAAALQKLGGRTSPMGPPPATPGPEITSTVSPPSPGLVRDYVRHVGGDPSAYKRTVPPHLFPQWTFPLAFETIRELPYPLLSALNGGCRMEVNRPIPQNEPMTVRARLEDIDDGERRVVLHQRIVTETPSAPEALVSHIYAVIPKPRPKDAPRGPKKEKPRVPGEARELAFWRLGPDAGKDFAILTGDFNPIHWIPLAARAQGFRNTILHGFATLGRAVEGLNTSLFAGRTGWLETVDVKFTRPLVLPARVGLYLESENRFSVGDAPGGPAYLTGQFTRKQGQGSR